MTTVIFGHRGIPSKFPENSLAGFRYAVTHGAEGLEFDVHLTADQVPVIMHDETINRTTDGTGAINQYTYQELRQFKLVNGEPIPILDQFLTLVEGQDIQLNLEFKTDKVHYPGIEKIVLDRMSQASLKHDVIYSSFSLPTLKTAQQLAPKKSYCYLADHKIDQPAQFIQTQRLAGLHLNHYQPSVGVSERIWTVNDPVMMKQLFSQQVAGIFTDDFEKAMQLRNMQAV